MIILASLTWVGRARFEIEVTWVVTCIAHVQVNLVQYRQRCNRDVMHAAPLASLA
jgi:hypothetical protein